MSLNEFEIDEELFQENIQDSEDVQNKKEVREPYYKTFKLCNLEVPIQKVSYKPFKKKKRNKPLDKNDKYSNRIHLSLTDENYSFIMYECKRLGISESFVVNTLIEMHIDRLNDK